MLGLSVISLPDKQGKSKSFPFKGYWLPKGVKNGGHDLNRLQLPDYSHPDSSVYWAGRPKMRYARG